MEQRRDDALDRLPAYQEDGVTVYLGDAREVMTNLPAESVDCVVTSPPYWGLRDFGVPPTVWGGDPACRHRWSGLQRGRRKDLLPSDSTARRARVGFTDRQDAAASNGGRFCLDCTRGWAASAWSRRRSSSSPTWSSCSATCAAC
jgi:DNA modification methylase